MLCIINDFQHNFSWTSVSNLSLLRRKECPIWQGHTLAADLHWQSTNCARFFSFHFMKPFILVYLFLVLTLLYYPQYVAGETLLQTEEIELYVVKECEPEFVSGEAKLDPEKYETQILGIGDQTLAEVTTNNLSYGHLV